MVSISSLVIFGLLTVYLVRKSSAKAGHMAVAVLFGIALAATPVGQQINSGANSALASVFNQVSSVLGEGKA